jgi:hypothetical protein
MRQDYACALHTPNFRLLSIKGDPHMSFEWHSYHKAVDSSYWNFHATAEFPARKIRTFSPAAGPEGGIGPPSSLSALIGDGDCPTHTCWPVVVFRPYTLPLLEPMSTVLLTTSGAVTRSPSPVKVHASARLLRLVDDSVPEFNAITDVLVISDATC